MSLTEEQRFILKGVVAVDHHDLTGRLTKHSVFNNMIMLDGLNLLRDGLRATDGAIKFLAWGTGTTAVANTQTALATEVGRKAITTQTPSDHGILQTQTYIAPNEGICAMKELAWFGGAAATVAAGSGTMYARVLYDHNKTNTESITVTRTDTITAV